MVNIAICDDEKIIRTQLYNIIFNYLEKRNLEAKITIYSTGKELIDKIDSIKIDFLFMDIELKESVNGIEIIKRIRSINKTMLVVFVTNYKDYLYAAMPLHTFDYIIKPFRNNDIYRVVDDLFYYANDNNENHKNKMRFKTIDGIISLDVEDILYFEYRNRRIDIVTKASRYHMYGKIREIYKGVKDYDFGIPHISYIVNMKEIEKILKSEFRIIMTNNESIPISQLKIKSFKKNI